MAEVSQFACAKPHPVRGREASCNRQRWHGGDHRATYDDRLLEWSDAPAPWDDNPFADLEPTILESGPVWRGNLIVWTIAVAIVVSVWIPAAIILWRQV